MTDSFDFEEIQAGLHAEHQWQRLLEAGAVKEFPGVEWHAQPILDFKACGICGCSIADHPQTVRAHEEWHRSDHRREAIGWLQHHQQMTQVIEFAKASKEAMKGILDHARTLEDSNDVLSNWVEMLQTRIEALEKHAEA